MNDQGIHKSKSKVARNEKRKKQRGFSYTLNIANFEAFRWIISLSANLLFLKSDDVCKLIVYKAWNVLLSHRCMYLKDISCMAKHAGHFKLIP